LIAYQRGSTHRLVILIANVAIGWTGVGWLAVLAVAVWPRNDALPVRVVEASPTGGEDFSHRSGNVVRRLADLAELKEAGVLSEAEFARKKREILSE
jgi:hypothetical protein